MTDADDVGCLDFINIGVDFGGNRSKTTYVAVGFSRCSEGYSLTVLDECVIDGGKGDIDPTKIEREMGEFLMKLREKYPGVSVRYIFADCEAQYLINGLRKHLKRLGETAVGKRLREEAHSRQDILCEPADNPKAAENSEDLHTPARRIMHRSVGRKRQAARQLYLGYRHT